MHPQIRLDYSSWQDSYRNNRMFSLHSIGLHMILICPVINESVLMTAGILVYSQIYRQSFQHFTIIDGMGSGLCGHNLIPL